MSFVIVGREALAATASDLTSLGSTISAANAAAAASTTGLLAAGADEVSAAIAALFGAYGQAHQALSAQAAAFHQEFVQALTAGAGSYAGADAAAASSLQTLLDGGPIYEAVQRANEKLLIAFTNVVGRLEQPLVPYFVGLFGPPVPPPVPFPAPIAGAVSLVLSGTEANIPNQYNLDLIAQEYNLPGGVGAVWQPSQFFPVSPHLGNLTLGQSIGQGVQYLDQAIQAEAGNHATNITVWTTSQSSVVATGEIRHLMSIGSPFQNQLHFILTGDPNNPDGGFFERIVGWYQPGIDVYLNGATPPNSPYPTTIYTNQYDMAGDFPQYILNPVSDINAIMGLFFGAHIYAPADLTAAIPLPTSPGYNGQTTYYFTLQQNLPLLAPVRNYVIPPWDDAISDLLTPDLRVLADLGYASGNYANIPTPGQFFELPDPFTIIPDLAVGTIQGPIAFAVDLGWLPPSMMPNTYPFVPTLDPHLNFPIGQHSVTGVSLITGAEGQLMRGLALIPSWWDGV
jgi:PE-PPE domain/PE family